MKITISITIAELQSLELWEDYCRYTGFDLYAAEGLGGDYELILTKDCADAIGLQLAEGG